MEEMTHGAGGAAGKVPELSKEEAARILDNVFKACGLPPNTIPLEKLEEKYRTMAGHTGV